MYAEVTVANRMNAWRMIERLQRFARSNARPVGLNSLYRALKAAQYAESFPASYDPKVVRSACNLLSSCDAGSPGDVTDFLAFDDAVEEMLAHIEAGLVGF